MADKPVTEQLVDLALAGSPDLIHAASAAGLAFLSLCGLANVPPDDLLAICSRGIREHIAKGARP